WYQLSVLAALLGSATKEVMVTAPAVLLVFDRVVLSPDWRTVIRRRLGYHLAATTACCLLPVFVHLFAVTPEERSATAVGGGALMSPTTYLFTQSTVLLHYLALAFWPAALSFEYRDWIGYSQFTSVWWQMLLCAAALAISI